VRGVHSRGLFLMVVLNPRNLIQHELIGLEVSVMESSNPFCVGISGSVIDETKNTLVVSQGKRRVIPKAIARFRFTLPDGRKVDVDGVRILGEPENRIKRSVGDVW